MDTKGKLIVLSRNKGVFMAVEVENKMRHPRKDVQRNADVTKRRFSAASTASARCSLNIEAAGTPDPNEVSGRYSPERGCHEVTGVEIIAKKKLGCLNRVNLWKAYQFLLSSISCIMLFRSLHIPASSRI